MYVRRCVMCEWWLLIESEQLIPPASSSSPSPSLCTFYYCSVSYFTCLTSHLSTSCHYSSFTFFSPFIPTHNALFILCFVSFLLNFFCSFISSLLLQFPRHPIFFYPFSPLTFILCCTWPASVCPSFPTLLSSFVLHFIFVLLMLISLFPFYPFIHLLLLFVSQLHQQFIIDVHVVTDTMLSLSADKFYFVFKPHLMLFWYLQCKTSCRQFLFRLYFAFPCDLKHFLFHPTLILFFLF